MKNYLKIPISPKTLFLIDGVGALLSAFMLGVVLVKFENIFGIPHRTLYFLAILPCIFALYDIVGYITRKEYTDILLKGIAYINFLYCILSLGLAIYHFHKITWLGWAYLLIEISIVLVLSSIEFKTGVNLHK